MTLLEQKRNTYFIKNYERIKAMAILEYIKVDDKVLNDLEDLIQETAIVMLENPNYNRDDLVGTAAKIARLKLNRRK